MTRRISSSLILALLFVALAAGSLEEGGTVTGAQMSQEAKAYLRDNQVLQSGEKVIVYYDETISLDHSNTYIVTDRRLVVHTAPSTTGIALANITNIDDKDEALAGKVITVRGSKAELLRLEIAHLNGGDFFLTELQRAASAAGASY